MNKETGSVAMEYALIITAIAVAIFATVFTFGEELKAFFENVQNTIFS